MIAAIYARKSTDQNVSDEEKSGTRQRRSKHQGPDVPLDDRERG